MDQPTCPQVRACRYQLPSPEHMGDRKCGRRWASGRGPENCTTPFIPIKVKGGVE